MIERQFWLGGLLFRVNDTRYCVFLSKFAPDNKKKKVYESLGGTIGLTKVKKCEEKEKLQITPTEKIRRKG